MTAHDKLTGTPCRVAPSSLHRFTTSAATAGRSTNRRILDAILIVGGLTVAVKLAQMVKEVIVAGSYGTGDALEAFLIAFLVPTFFINVVGSSFNAALIPVYIETREKQGAIATERLLSGVVLASIGLLTILTAIVALAGPYALRVLAPGFRPDKLALTRDLFYWLLPSILVSGLVTIWGAVLNAEEHFGWISLSAGVPPLAAIVSLVAFGKVWGIHALVLGTVVGLLLQLVALARGLKRHRIKLRPRWHGADPAVRQVIRQYIPMAAAATLMCSTQLVDQAFAGRLGRGSVASLTYGNRIVGLVLNVGSTALGTAVLPYFSKMVAAGDWTGMRHSLRTYSRLTLCATVPITLLLVISSRSLIGLSLQRGAFTATDTAIVSQVLAMYALQLPFHLLGILFVRLISSLQANYILTWGTVISAVLNISLDYAFMRVLGLPGIALSTSLVYFVSCGYLGLSLHRKLQRAQPKVATFV